MNIILNEVQIYRPPYSKNPNAAINDITAETRRNKTIKITFE